MARVVDARGFGFWDGQFWAWDSKLGEGKGGSSQAISVSIDTYGLLDEHSLQAHQGACSSVA